MFEDGDNWHISLMDKVTATELNPPVSCVCHKISQQILTTQTDSLTKWQFLFYNLSYMHEKANRKL